MEREAIKKITFLDLDKSTLPLNWFKNGLLSKIEFPKQLINTKANIIILSPENFPTSSSNDGVAFFSLKRMITGSLVVDNTVEVCAMDSMITSYAWAASILGLKITIRTPQMTNKYWIKRAKDYGADIIHEGIKTTDTTRIFDTHKKKKNFVNQFKEFAGYAYHKVITSEAIKKAVDGVGNNKVALLITPSSSGALSGAADGNKKNFPYSKNLLIEPEASSTFFNNQKGEHRLYGMGYGFIPYIYNVSTIDYIMPVEEDVVIKVLKCIEEFNSKISSEFNLNSKELKPIVGKLGLPAVGAIIAAKIAARQLHLTEEDNIVIISEDLSSPYKETLKTELMEDIDVKHIIEENLINEYFKPLLDVTGQRQQERLMKKKTDYWLRRMENEEILKDMKNSSFWEKIN